MSSDLTVIVLAAGGGTRMRSKRAKVLHEIAGRSMIDHVLLAVQALEPQQVVAVVGHQRDQVGPHIQQLMPQVTLAVQDEQKGTGHAVRIALEAAGTTSGTVLVAAGDTPLLQGDSLRGFAQEHRAADCAVSVLSGIVEQPHGYGRIVRNDEGDVEGIVEEKDATAEQREIREISSGILAFDAEFLVEALPRVGNDNAKGEYYLTDVVGLAREAGLAVGAFPLDDVMQTEGANDRVQLAQLGRELNRRIVEGWMREGVTVMDPATTWVDADVVLAPDVTILPGTQLLGATVVGEDAVIGPDTTLKDCRDRQRRARRAHPRRARRDRPRGQRRPVLLPPARYDARRGRQDRRVRRDQERPDRRRAPRCRTCPTSVTPRSATAPTSAPARSSPTTTGRTSTAPTVGKGAKTGANNTFVAPVTIGDGAVTGGGTVVRRDVPPGTLAVSGGPQRNLERRPRPRHPRTPRLGNAADGGGES